MFVCLILCLRHRQRYVRGCLRLSTRTWYAALLTWFCWLMHLAVNDTLLVFWCRVVCCYNSDIVTVGACLHMCWMWSDVFQDHQLNGHCYLVQANFLWLSWTWAQLLMTWLHNIAEVEFPLSSGGCDQEVYCEKHGAYCVKWYSKSLSSASVTKSSRDMWSGAQCPERMPQRMTASSRWRSSAVVKPRHKHI